MEIQTFVFFDLETTGLIQGKLMPKITEIALIAVARKALCNDNKNFLPRVLHKLVLPVNPQKVIPANVECITKLCNKDMQVLQPFECEIYELITHFLQRLTPPICFAAHNGNRFDYPIFLWELEYINKAVQNEILCIDTCKMFRDFFKETRESRRDTTLPNPAHLKELHDLLNDDYDEYLSDALDSVMKEGSESESKVAATSRNDRTRILKQAVNERTPEEQMIKAQNVHVERPCKKIEYSRRRLEFEEEKPVNFKLAVIHEYMFGSSFAHEHSAEADCLAMIRCVGQIADFFVVWSDAYARPLVHCRGT